MPTYAYACQSCGHQFEVKQSFTEDALTVCPECDGQLRKLFNNVGVVFKGSGFYRNDSRGSSSSSSDTKSASSSNESKSSESKSSESKSSTPKTESTSQSKPSSTSTSSSGGSSSAA